MLQPLIDELVSTPTVEEIFVIDADLRVVLRGTEPGDLLPVAIIDRTLPGDMGHAVRAIVANHDFERTAIAVATSDGVALRVLRLAGTATAFYAVMILSQAR